ncbi:MAG: hypothetical protein D3903_20695 [Candidatus Electrothrix sp. GM3_4]|nr:hypothetical protein [Candidatus Electrothrix sp. GM3_4]
MFILSILWRLSVSSDKNFSVNLDAHEQEILRKRLLNENPGLPTEFPFYTILVRIDGEMNSNIIMNPIELKHPYQNSVALYIAGILFLISKTRLNTFFLLMPSCLKKDGWVVQNGFPIFLYSRRNMKAFYSVKNMVIHNIG